MHIFKFMTHLKYRNERIFSNATACLKLPADPTLNNTGEFDFPNVMKKFPRLVIFVISQPGCEILRCLSICLGNRLIFKLKLRVNIFNIALEDSNIASSIHIRVYKSPQIKRIKETMSIHYFSTCHVAPRTQLHSQRASAPVFHTRTSRPHVHRLSTGYLEQASHQEGKDNHCPL